MGFSSSCLGSVSMALPALEATLTALGKPNPFLFLRIYQYKHLSSICLNAAQSDDVRHDNPVMRGGEMKSVSRGDWKDLINTDYGDLLIISERPIFF